MSELCNWLLMKRDLYERPGHMGYTGIRDNAGRFAEEDAKSSVGDGGYGVTMIRLENAPEFTSACFDDLARDHLARKRDDALAMVRDAFKAGWRTNATTEQPDDYLDGCEEVDWREFTKRGLAGYLVSLTANDNTDSLQNAA